MTRFSELMSGQTLLPIIQTNSPEEGVLIAKSMSDAGLKLVEVVLRTSESINALKAIKSELPDLNVGAGTILNSEVLENAIEAGADFIVTPAVSESLLRELVSCHLPVLPGVSNTGEILLASEFGFEELKLFPASLSGGAPFLASLASVFQSIRFCPTGGVNQENKTDYLSLNNVFAVGGTWVAQKEWVAQKKWQAITNACHEALH